MSQGMGLFGGKKRRSSKGSPVYVKVKFTDLTREPNKGASRYAYRWSLPSEPNVGDRVMVPGLEGLSPAVVMAVTKTPGYSGEILDVARRVEKGELAAAQRKVQAEQAKALNNWRAKQGTSTGASAAATAPAAAALLQRLRLDTRALVRGRHYTEWVEPIKQLKRDRAHYEAVALLRECQQATLRADPGRPAPWYFEQEAIICRKDGHLDAEAAVLRRYLDACRGEPHKGMVERWGRVQELLQDRHAKQQERG